MILHNNNNAPSTIPGYSRMSSQGEYARTAPPSPSDRAPPRMLGPAFPHARPGQALMACRARSRSSLARPKTGPSQSHPTRPAATFVPHQLLFRARALICATGRVAQWS